MLWQSRHLQPCAVLFICVFSTSTAIFLILELGQPFDGLMQIPNAALRHALAALPS